MTPNYKGTETAEPMAYKLSRRPKCAKILHLQSRDKIQSVCYWLFSEQLMVLV